VVNRESGFKNLVQLQLFSDGRFAFIYKKVGGDADLVGASPGGGLTDLERVDISNPSNSPVIGAPFEYFTQLSGVDVFQVGKLFYETHGDDYDFLYMWTDFDVDLGGAFAYYLGASNNTRGIGISTYSRAGSFGSAGKLQGFLNMNSIFLYPNDPDAQFLGMNSTYSILGQEQGHRWLAFVNFKDGNSSSSELLGRSDSHWSPYFNTESTISPSGARNSSSVEGNSIDDMGGGGFVTNQRAINYFSELDQYLMGVRGADEVSDMFLVKNGSGFSGTNPRTGIRLRGTRKRVSVDDIIAAEGERVPNVTESQKEWRAAWILLVQHGDEPSEATVQRLQALQRGWETYFNRALDGRGTITTALVPR
jgi:large repetitive protein